MNTGKMCIGLFLLAIFCSCHWFTYSELSQLPSWKKTKQWKPPLLQWRISFPISITFDLRGFHQIQKPPRSFMHLMSNFSNFLDLIFSGLAFLLTLDSYHVNDICWDLRATFSVFSKLFQDFILNHHVSHELHFIIALSNSYVMFFLFLCIKKLNSLIYNSYSYPICSSILCQLVE